MQGQIDPQQLKIQLMDDLNREVQGVNMDPQSPALDSDVEEDRTEEKAFNLYDESYCRDEAGSPVLKPTDQRIIPAHIEFRGECDSCTLKYRSKKNRNCGGNGSNSGSKDCKAALHIFFESHGDDDDDEQQAGEEINYAKKEKNISSEKTCFRRACRSCYLGKVKCVFSHPGAGCDRCRRLNRPCIPNVDLATGKREKRKLLSDSLNRHQGLPCKRTEGCLRPHRHPGHCRLGETRNVVRARRRLARIDKLKKKKAATQDKNDTRVKKKRRISSSSKSQGRTL